MGGGKGTAFAWPRPVHNGSHARNSGGILRPRARTRLAWNRSQLPAGILLSCLHRLWPCAYPPPSICECAEGVLLGIGRAHISHGSAVAKSAALVMVAAKQEPPPEAV